MKKITSLIAAGALLLSVAACGVSNVPQYRTPSYNITPASTFNAFTLADKLNIVDMSNGTSTVQPFTSELVLATAMGKGDQTSNLTLNATGQNKKGVAKQSMLFNKSSIQADTQFKATPFEAWLQNQREQAANYLKTSYTAKRLIFKKKTINVGDKETFWIQDLRNGINNPKEVKQTFVLKKISTHGYFMVDEEDLDGITLNGKTFHLGDAYIDKMAEYWENVAYPTDAKYFGGISPVTIDNDQHFYFFLSSKLGTQVLGYFSPMDLIGKPTSNNHKILYINDLFATDELGPKYEGTLHSTIIHEFQHFLNFDHKVFQPAVQGNQNDIAMEELWLNEAMSTLAEQLGGFGLPASEVNSVGMVKGFLEDAPNAPLVTKTYQKFQYGEAYLFALYLYEQFGGEKLTTALINSKLVGIKNVENATGQDFAKTFTNWGLALCFDDLNNVPQYNYKSINLNGTYLNYKFNGLKYEEVTSYPYNFNKVVDNWSFSAFKFNGGDGTSNLSLKMKTSGKLLATGIAGK